MRARQVLGYSAGLIALYLLVVNAAGASKVTKTLADGASAVVRTFQGR